MVDQIRSAIENALVDHVLHCNGGINPYSCHWRPDITAVYCWMNTGKSAGRNERLTSVMSRLAAAALEGANDLPAWCRDLPQRCSKEWTTYQRDVATGRGGAGRSERLTSVMSRLAAAALMWRLGWRTVLVQSSARANVPTDLSTNDHVIKCLPQSALPLCRLVRYGTNAPATYARDTLHSTKVTLQQYCTRLELGLTELWLRIGLFVYCWGRSPDSRLALIWLSRFRQNFPWEASPEAFSEVIFDENIGRTDKLSRSC